MAPSNLFEILAVATPTALVTAGVAYGAIKKGLNGTVEKVHDIHTEVRDQGRCLSRVREDVAFLKGRLDIEVLK